MPHWPNSEDLGATPDEQLFLVEWRRTTLKQLRWRFRNIIIYNTAVCRKRPRGSCSTPKATLLLSAYWDVDAGRTWPELVRSVRQGLDEQGRKDMIIEIRDVDWYTRTRYKSMLEKEHPFAEAYEEHILLRINRIMRKREASCGKRADSVVEVVRLGYNSDASENAIYVALAMPHWSKPVDWEEPRHEIQAMLAVEGFADVGVEFTHKEY